jgi:DNA-binding GntR family transcriptional regulator
MKNKDLLVHIKRRRAESLASLVADEIERMIVRGELQSGDRINESVLAQKFGISRGPIREACRSLEKSNLIRVVTNRGVFVREMSVARIVEIYDVLAHLSGLAGRFAASRISLREVAELRAMVAEMQEAKDKKDVDRYYTFDLAFHTRLVELSGNKRLAEICINLWKELHLFRYLDLLFRGDRMALSNREHGHFIEALKDHDCDLAERIMADHLLAAKASLLQRVKEQYGKVSEPSPRAGNE